MVSIYFLLYYKFTNAVQQLDAHPTHYITLPRFREKEAHYMMSKMMMAL